MNNNNSLNGFGNSCASILSCERKVIRDQIQNDDVSVSRARIVYQILGAPLFFRVKAATRSEGSLESSGRDLVGVVAGVYGVLEVRTLQQPRPEYERTVKRCGLKLFINTVTKETHI
jgi:hypothetical protein